MLNNILEISKRASKNGRVPIKIALLKIHNDSTSTNKNGLHWKKEYVQNAMDSVIGMPLCTEFADDDKEVPIGHGLTGSEYDSNGNAQPVFENSVVVGTCESVSIETIIDENGNEIEVLATDGYLYNQRYPKFVKWVRKNYAIGKVDTSIEIMGTPENENQIIYEEDEPKEEFRTPKTFCFTGSAILGVSPADDDAIVLEVAQKKENKEENKEMEFNMDEIKSTIQATISEMNEKSESYETKISELNSQIESKDAELAEKDSKISELNASIADMQKVLDDIRAEQSSSWDQIRVLEKEIAKAKVAEKLSEVDSALGEFSAEEKEVAKDDIDKLKENINACKKKEELNNVTSEINSIKSKICMNIVEKQKKAEADAKIAEQNSKKETVETEDIFSEMCTEVNTSDEEDLNIF